MPRDFLVKEGFLPAAACRELAAFYVAHTHLCQREHAEFWANRLMGLNEVRSVDPNLAGCLVEILQSAIGEIESFYASPRRLYADVMTIVGWPEGSQMPLHADNAYADGSVHALAHRLYSGVVYLTDDYTGGELFIGEWERSREFLHPAVGTLVSLPCGLSHQHGVKQVTDGLRLALTFFLTDDQARMARELKALEAV